MTNDGRILSKEVLEAYRRNARLPITQELLDHIEATQERIESVADLICDANLEDKPPFSEIMSILRGWTTTDSGA